MQTEQNTFLGDICNPDLNNETIEIRYKSKNGRMESFFSNDLEEINKKVEVLKTHNDIYFGIAPRKNTDSGKKGNCSSISSLWVDIDCGQDGHKKSSFFESKEAALAHIRKLPIVPSVIVDSGNGLHLYFFVNEKLILDEETILSVEKANRQLGLIYGGDSVHNVDRIMRMPGTQNHKNDIPKDCKVLEYNPDQIYSANFLIEEELLNINWDRISKVKISNVPVYDLLFGKNLDELKKSSRSEIDQAIIIKLLSENYTNTQIENIFQIFPTSGKYNEHPDKDKYLHNSIIKGQKFINENYTVSNFPKGKEKYQLYYEILSDNFVSTKNSEHEDICNFVFRINQIIKRIRDGNTEATLNGVVYFADKIQIPFNNVSADILFDGRSFNKFITHLAPTRPIISKWMPELLSAVNYLNRDAEHLVEKEFGYNKDKTEFLTQDLIITKDDFVRKDTPIKYSEIWGNNKIGFSTPTTEELESIKKSILEKLFTWDNPEVISSTLAFSMLPLIHPLMVNKLPNKFYLMLRGSSGSGKTHLAKICQNFYGDFQNLVSWTSTDTSINIIGNAFKDALFVVDDFKKQNFKTDNAIKQAMAIIQNYSDGTGRLRANVDLAIKDERFIKGWLMISAEDVVFTESSTIARGVIIPIVSKEYKPKEAAELLDISRSFKGISAYFIQYLLQANVKENILDLLEENIEFFSRTIDDIPEISLDNLSRIINNFAVLKTSWNVFSSFLIQDETMRIKHNQIYESKLRELFLENVQRIDEAKSERLFEQTLWSMVDSKKIYFEKLLLNNIDYYTPESKGVKVGEYLVYSKNDIRICLNMNTAYKEIIKYNADIQVTLDTLMDKLVHSNKIEINNSKRVYFAPGKHGTGVKWIGKFPRNLFGLNDDCDVLETAKMIISDSFVTDEFMAEVDPSSKIQINEDDNIQF